MYIRKAVIRNIRGISHAEVDLERTLPDPERRTGSWNVFAGRNGSGKSTLLKALALGCVGNQVALRLEPSYRGWIRNGTERAEAELVLTVDAELDRFTRHGYDSGEVKGQLLWQAADGATRDEPTIFGGGEGELQYGPWQSNGAAWFVTGYGPMRRLTGDAHKAHRPSPRVERLMHLFSSDVTLFEAVSWLRDVDYDAKNGDRGAKELKQQVLRLLNDGLLPDGGRAVRVDPDGLWMELDGTALLLQEMGDGFSITAALVTDLVRKLYEAYGRLRIEQRPASGDDRPPGTGIQIMLPGVVFIDEVEQHLHASWQQGIGFWLKNHFPALQFIVATHSPFVCQAATPGGLFRMPGPGEGRQVERVPDEVFNEVVHGTIDDAVLSALFGLDRPYSEASERLRDRLSELEVRQQTGELSSAEREELARLSARMPRGPGANLEQMLRRLEAKR